MRGVSWAVNRPSAEGHREPIEKVQPVPPSPAGGWTHLTLFCCSAPASMSRVTVVLLVAGNTVALGTESGSIFFLDVATLTLLEGQTLSPDEVLRR